MSNIARVRRWAAFRALWQAIRAGHRPGAPAMGDRIRALPRLARATARGHYQGLSRTRLAMFAVGIAYLVSPIDVMPELLLAFFGLGDDAVVALWLAGSFLDETERYLTWERSTPPPSARE